MRHIQLIGLASLVCVGLFMGSCSKKESLEKQVVGTYKVDESQQSNATSVDPAMMTSLNYVQEFRTDRTFRLEGTLKMVVMLEDSVYANVLGFEYAIEAKGNWEVKGDSLFQRIDPNDVNIVLAESIASEEDEVSNYVLGTLQESIELSIPQMKESLNSSAQIMKVDSTEMILKSNQGDEMIYMRLK